MTARIVLSFSLMTDTELDSFAERVGVKMTNNSYFISIVPIVANFVVLATDFRGKLSAASTRDSLKIAAKNATKKELIVQLRQLGLYVQAIATGLSPDEAHQCLLSSGFDLQKERGSTDIPSVPTNLKVTSGKISGTLKVSFTSTKFATHYDLRYREQGTDWGNPIEVTTRHLISGLSPAVYYEFQVRAIGRKGEGNWSQIITKLCTDGE